MVFAGPGVFKKVQEACEKNLHLVAPQTDFVVPSYEQKIENSDGKTWPQITDNNLVFLCFFWEDTEVPEHIRFS